MKHPVAGLLLLISPWSSTSHGASSICSKAIPKIEKMICANDSLSRLDTTLSGSYEKTLTASNVKKRPRGIRSNALTSKNAAGYGERWPSQLEVVRDPETRNQSVHHYRFSVREQARQALFESIEVFYNRIRRHATIGNQALAKSAKQYYAIDKVSA